MASLACYALAVLYVGLSVANDRAVWRYAYENDLTVITTNAKDILALLNVEVHPGLIVLRESGLSRQEQWERIEPVLRYLLERNDPNFVLNKVMRLKRRIAFQRANYRPPSSPERPPCLPAYPISSAGFRPILSDPRPQWIARNTNGARRSPERYIVVRRKESQWVPE